MSRASRITLATVSATTCAIIFGVHYIQQADKESMHQGVLRDEERRALRRERQEEFDRQRSLEAALKQDQTVHET